MLVPGTPLHAEWEAKRFSLISPFQSLVELKLIIQNSNFSDCFFTANHASNYLPIKVQLPRKKATVLEVIDDVLSSKDLSRLRPEHIRAL